MKKRGISLIVLIITIVVIIVLATAIIVNIVQTNIIKNANEAVQKNNETQINQKAQILLMEYLIEKNKGTTLKQFLDSKQSLKEIDNYEINNDGTFKVVMSDYYVIIDEENLNVSKAKLCSDVEIGYKINEFLNGKIKVTVNVKSNMNIKKIEKSNGQELAYDNLKEVSFDEEIEANIEYSYNVTLISGAQSKQTIIYEDVEAPIASIEIQNPVIFKNSNDKTIKADINIIDEKSGVDIKNCKWVLSKEANKSVLSESEYTEEFASSQETISTTLKNTGTYYIHILVKDNVGNVDEIVSKEIIYKNGYGISTADELQAMGTNLSANYYLAKNIDLNGYKFSMIEGTFTGSIDGMGHKISNLTMSTTTDYLGIFKQIEKATIKNIIFENVNLTSSAKRVGVISAYAKYGSTFEKVGITGKISANNRVGSFIGTHLGYNGTTNFTNCYARTNITCTSPYDSAGFIGDYSKNASRPDLTHMIKITNCYAAFKTNANRRTGVFRGGYSVDNNDNQEVGETKVTDSYYNSDLFKLSVPVEISGTGLSTLNMSKQSSYNNWDFENTWYIGESGYPELKFIK